MKKIFLLAFMAWATYASKGQSGTLDPSFGNNGLIVTPADSAGNPIEDQMDEYPRKCFIMPDGKLVMVTFTAGKTMLTRRLANGDPDPGFGINGFSQGVSLILTDAATQPDGKIIVAGTNEGVRSIYFGIPNGIADVMLARYNADGTIDPSFGINGIVITDLGSPVDFVSSVVIANDGKIIVGGSTEVNGLNHFALVRYSPSGVVDAGFGNNGVVITNFDDAPSSITSLGLQADGKIVAAGTASAMSLARYNPDGSPDLTFNSIGRMVTSFPVFGSVSLAIATDGKIYTGSTYNGYRITRHNPDGSLDLTYNSGTGFVVTVTSEDFSRELTHILLQPDGKLLAVGDISPDERNPRVIVVVRLNPDGSMDNGFDEDGQLGLSADIPNGISSDQARFLNIQPDGKIIVGSKVDNVFFDIATGDFFAIHRINTDGTDDVTFGGDGQILDFIPVFRNSYHSAFLQTDDKLLVAGGSAVYPDSTSILSRFNPDGTPDNSYGQDGIIKINRVNDSLGFFLPDGKLITLDYSLIVRPTISRMILIRRYNSDGSPDNSFGINGAVTFITATDEFPPNARFNGQGGIVLQPDGKLVFGVGRPAESGSWIIRRLNSDGSIDGNFGIGGSAQIDFAEERSEFVQSLKVAVDGKIVIGGSGIPIGGNFLFSDFLFARLNADGSPDNSFGQQGKLIVDRSPADNMGSLIVQEDGKILYSSSSVPTPSPDIPTEYFLDRLNLDGSPDEEFGHKSVDGVLFVLQNDQKILSGGTRINADGSINFTLTRFNPDGSLDNAFGVNGKTINSLSVVNNYPAVLLYSGNSLYAVGSGTDNLTNRLGVIAKFQLGTSAGNLTCPQNKIVLTDKGVCSAKVYKIDPVVSGTKNPAVTYTLTGATTGTGTGSASSKTFNRGVTTVTYTLSSDPTQTCSFTVTVKDKEVPVITGLSVNPTTLWPPNRKMVEVTLTYQATDNCGAPRVALGISSNEAVTSSDNGDQSPDWQIIDANRVRLRAERLNSGNGRVYTIRVFATDPSGNQTVQSVTVKVPKNQSPGETDLKVTIAPNPTSSYFNVYLTSSSDERINLRVLNLKGVVLFTINNVSPHQNLKIGDKLGAGVYFLEVTQGTTKKTVKLIKN